MSKYGTKGGDGATIGNTGSILVRSSGPVCSETSYVIGSLPCARCSEPHKLHGRQGERRVGYRFRCSECKIINVCTPLDFHGFN